MKNGKKSVLIVDDEAGVREVLRDIVCEFENVTVVEAADGVEALRKIALQQFDLMIMDMKMPRMDGLGLVDGIVALKQTMRPSNIIIISGQTVDMEFFEELNNVSYLPKPLERETLKKSLTPVLTIEATEVREKAKIDVSFINPFIDAALLVLGTMASTTATKESVFVRQGDQIGGDVSAVIAMNGSKFNGSMAISFEANSFLAIVNKMLSENYTEVNGENSDAAGEICNQIFGVAKKKLNAAGYDIRPALPSVVFGRDHKIKHLIDGTCIAVKFKTDAGSFVIEAVLKAVASASKAA